MPGSGQMRLRPASDSSASRCRLPPARIGGSVSPIDRAPAESAPGNDFPESSGRWTTAPLPDPTERPRPRTVAPRHPRVPAPLATMRTRRARGIEQGSAHATAGAGSHLPEQGRAGRAGHRRRPRPGPGRGGGAGSRPAGCAIPICTTSRAGSVTTTRTCSATRPPASSSRSARAFATWRRATT